MTLSNRLPTLRHAFQHPYQLWWQRCSNTFQHPFQQEVSNPPYPPRVGSARRGLEGRCRFHRCDMGVGGG
jgi:hypothetical protein